VKKKEKAAAGPQTEQQTAPAPEEKEKKGALVIIVDVLLVLVILVAAACTYVSFVNTSGSGVPSLFGIRLLSVQTESMYPTIKPGDLIYDKAVKDTGALRTGDIITYWTIINGERVLNTHRITEIYDGGGYLIFATKGDNNSVEDPLTVHESEVIGVYAGRIQGLGKVFDYLQTSTGFLIVVVIPVALFFIYHLVQFFRTLFEYQKVKNMLQYELEREKLTGAGEEESEEQTRMKEREKLEAELREKLREELLAAGAAAAGGKPKPEEAEAPAPEAPEAPAPEGPAPEAAAEPGAAEAQPEAEREALKAQLRAELEAEAQAKRDAELEAMRAELRAQLEAEMKGSRSGDTETPEA
jgi:signal peptidase